MADKRNKAGWHATKSEFVDAPLIDELPMAVECRPVGEIANVDTDESVLDANGKIDPDKLQPIIFDPIHSAYRKLGEKVGNTFRDGAKLNWTFCGIKRTDRPFQRPSVLFSFGAQNQSQDGFRRSICLVRSRS